MKFIKDIEKIIYPFYNGTSPWYKTTRWEAKMKNGDTIYFYNHEVVRLIEYLMGEK